MGSGSVALAAIATVAVAAIAWLAVVAFKGAGIRVPARLIPAPTETPDAARDRLATVLEDDPRVVREDSFTRLALPEGPMKAFIVAFHGFTNSPAQFGEVVDALVAEGYGVLVPRAPYQGEIEPTGAALAKLTDDDLAIHVEHAIDVATGFEAPVWALGLSGGGVLAAWAAATRPEVRRVAVAAPIATPLGTPYPAVRLAVPLGGAIPSGVYIWWDSKVKLDLPRAPFAYPGFPLKGIVPYLRFSVALRDGRMKPGWPVEHAGLILNPIDKSVEAGTAREMMLGAFDEDAVELIEYDLDAALGWDHDFVSPIGDRAGSGAQVARIFLEALGVTGAEAPEIDRVSDLRAPQPAPTS